MAFKARQLDVQDKKLPALCAVVKKGTPQSDCPDCFSTPPKNWAECLKRPDRQLWIDALQAEEDGFDGEELPKKRIKRLSQSELADGAFIARGSVVLTIKWDSEGGLLVYNKHKVQRTKSTSICTSSGPHPGPFYHLFSEAEVKIN